MTSTTKNLSKATVRKLLNDALKDKADGHPTKLATLIDYNYPNLAGVIAGRRKLPISPTASLCKLLGREDPIELYQSQWSK